MFSLRPAGIPHNIQAQGPPFPPRCPPASGVVELAIRQPVGGQTSCDNVTRLKGELSLIPNQTGLHGLHPSGLKLLPLLCGHRLFPSFLIILHLLPIVSVCVFLLLLQRVFLSKIRYKTVLCLFFLFFPPQQRAELGISLHQRGCVQWEDCRGAKGENQGGRVEQCTSLESGTV